MTDPGAHGATHDTEQGIAFVTGGGGGIGSAVVTALAEAGQAVAVFDLDEDAATAVAAGLGDRRRWVAGGLDVRDGAAVDAAVGRVESTLGPITTVVTVAGVLQHGMVGDISDEQWRETFGVNVDGVFHVARATTARMRDRGHGSFVAVASNAAGVPRRGMAAYAASKAAASHFTHCLGLELAPSGVRCNVVSPGSTETSMLYALWDDPSGRRKTLEGISEDYRVGIPLGRVATPRNIADAVVFLASDKAEHITMQDLYVDGGAALRS